MKDMFEEKGVSMKGGSTQIQSGGKPRTIRFGKTPEVTTDPTFTFQSLSNLQVKKGFSDSQTLEIAKFMRYEAGRNIVESNLVQKFAERNKLVEDYFVLKEFDFKKKVKPVKGDVGVSPKSSYSVQSKSEQI